MRDFRRAGVAVAGLTAALIGAQEWMARRYYAGTPGPREFVDSDARAAWTAVWHEFWAPLELALLHASAVYRGLDVPHGAGDPVVLVHGLFMRGRYLRPMERWLRGLGYRAQIAGIGLNADCIDVMTERLLGVVAAATARLIALSIWSATVWAVSWPGRWRFGRPSRWPRLRCWDRRSEASESIR